MIISMAGSNLLQVTQKFGTMFGLSTETAQLVAGWLTFADNTLAAMLSAKDFGDFAADMIDKYMVNGAEFSIETVLEIAMLGSYGLQTSTYANYTISMGSYLQTCLDAYDGKLIEDLIAQSEVVASCDSRTEYQDVIDPACFVAGTKVMTADGLKDIEDVEVGDYVLAENPETGEQEYKEVVNTYIHEKDIIVHIYVGDDEIETTREHPFYVEGIGFVQAGSLKPGDILRLADGRNLEVREVETEHLSEPVYVYNFEVEDYHTYFVSGLGVLVHNSCGPGNKSGSNTYVPSSNTQIVQHPEVKAPNQVKASDVTNYWDNYLGSNQTNINPRTGLVDNNRLFSADGTRSIRFGNHEMNSVGTTKFHFHQEEWKYDPNNDVMEYFNTLIRIKE